MEQTLRGTPARAMATIRSGVKASTVFGALMRRDLRVARKELPFFLVRVALQPLLFTIVFGYLLPKMGFIGRGSPSTGGVYYTTALLPGILAISITLSSIQSVALPMVQDFGWTLEIEDRLLAPVSTSLIAVEKLVMGVLQGCVAALFVLPIARLIMGPIPDLSVTNLGLVAIVTILGAATFSSLGLLLGSAINPQQIGLMFSVIIAPMIMFGCAYYPWKGLETVPVLKWVVLINPLVYVAEGLRAALTPSVAHMRLDVVLGALIVLGSLFWMLGLRSFHRRAIG